ncbi:uncharacterized protein MELLADRAFT_63354 [Melampsora larici-populina 98AG31]|uniref:Uncharacterized protein n=1 Tax=Melampsora larici-populina (strain 98AG31 / pathotype 3-4-7) TaxID=747676 RepID=F4RMC9_MELLP|nr:uncharacterized protein MELLADRAFT_63354 [Melampsora larici-populina 98AG31]EGG06496.1 hypothetical protein MELLADRAFT_63354 [Melampsora larici-populina 98AG31]
MSGNPYAEGGPKAGWNFRTGKEAPDKMGSWHRKSNSSEQKSSNASDHWKKRRGRGKGQRPQYQNEFQPASSGNTSYQKPTQPTHSTSASEQTQPAQGPSSGPGTKVAYAAQKAAQNTSK